jgi:predicted DNA-binding protein
MPSQKPRVALTLPDDLNAVFERLSQKQGVPKTKIIIELLSAYQPILEETLDALDKIEKDKDNAKQIAKEFGQNLLLDANMALGMVSKEVKDL